LLNAFSRNPLDLHDVFEQLKDRLSHDQVQNLENEIEILKSKKILTSYYLSHNNFFEILNEKRRGMDFLKYDDWGMTVSNCGKENLSPGCQSCKDGRWICIFPGFSCNAECKFCPRLTKGMVEKPLMNPITQDLLLMAIDANKDRISGISISGGELFFKNYGIAKNFIKRIKTNYPHIYLWGYTNGIAAAKDNMQELRDLGLEELRFNLAATDFDQRIIDKIKEHAVKIYPWVTVEVPIYNESFHHLIKREKLKELAGMGVKQLNLAEVRVPTPADLGSEDDISPAARHFLKYEDIYQFDCLSIKVLSVVQSRLYTYDIFEYAYRQNIDIRINDCSQEAKVVQIAGRTARGLDKISKDVDAFSNY
ncbi:MAG: 4Fe-4S cluster-binding domain-containing protein, partial [Acidobacteria bacterium]|nr:4Fe-4S cluster-binding domain-containing protein [Acidobacteriota bacterium]